MPKSIINGSSSELTPEERFLEIRDIFVTVLRRINTDKNSDKMSDNRLGYRSEQSVYATR